MNASGRIALGMSGGVDSAVSAALLMRAGYEVVGVTCRFRDNAATERAAADAAAVCSQLGIRHEAPGCVGEFERCVVEPFVSSYAAGLTPSPCVGCNARCKMPALVRVAGELGCDRIATGHYARIARLSDSGRFVVKRALDARKDQSYMLSLLSQEQLARLVLPLGAMTKAEVRVIAADLGLVVAEKAESQDNCFIEGDYRPFLRARGVEDAPGDIVDRMGNVLGCHEGLANYTVGQRKGIGVAGPGAVLRGGEARRNPRTRGGFCRRDAHRLRRGGRDELAGLSSAWRIVRRDGETSLPEPPVCVYHRTGRRPARIARAAESAANHGAGPIRRSLRRRHRIGRRHD